jgi:hypothetical protein
VVWSPVWTDVVEREGSGRVDAPTTLGRIDATLARRIIARGYLNTFLVSLYLAPLGDGDLARVESLSERLDCMLPRSATATLQRSREALASRSALDRFPTDLT